MKREAVEKIADAVLYEGYMLYPYTASSLKNQQRWNFGVLYPAGVDTCEMRTECLVAAGENCLVSARVRFLWYAGGEEPEQTEIDLQGWDASTAAELANGGRALIVMGSHRVGGNLHRLTVTIRNETPFDGGDVSRRSMLATHTILTATDGRFVSLMDPPDEYRDAAAKCQNTGTWPVLVGDEAERDSQYASTLLSSPIILYDYPQVAPESPGDLFDGCEIDEILTLRILTLSDSEKAEIRSGPDRARQILERTEALPPEQILKLHGAVRGLRPAAAIKTGDRVRLHPRRSADIFDIALAGKLATVEAVERDMEGNTHVAVVLDDDPGRELGMLRQPGHRFFFGLEEVERAS
ncbi:MAG TPA: hypothetical protein VG456_26770 [Candidatus Sulfopaludibacter sp.]|jgi:hypothetical protein|nr:hypothetical protein [Candidatus Sulfopaludibacter sp.]